MKPSHFLTICLLIGLSAPAQADFVTIARAYEVALSDFRAPASLNGTAGFKTCTDCDSQVVRVTPNTRYVVNSRGVDLDEFRSAIATITDRAAGTVIVKHHLESDTLTVISIDL